MAIGLLGAEHQHSTGAAGLQPAQGLLERSGRKGCALGMQCRALAQAAQALMHRMHHQISACRQGADRQAGIKAEVPPMGLIDQHRHAIAMGDGHQRRQITG